MNIIISLSSFLSLRYMTLILPPEENEKIELLFLFSDFFLLISYFLYTSYNFP